MLSNISKVLIAHISFTTVINNGGIGKGIGGTQKGTKKNYITFCNLLCGVGDEKKKTKTVAPNNSPTLPQERFKIFATSPVPFVSLAKRLWSLAPV